MTVAATPRTIPFFNYRAAFSSQADELVRIFRDVLDRGAFIQQRDLEQFEQHLASYLGVRHAIGVGNATDGLELIWHAVGLRPGDEVLFPSHTMVATAASVVLSGGVPVPVDCGPDHLMDPDSAERAITPRTRFIMPVQLNGRTCDMDRITAIANAHSLSIVEDAAQALGSKFGGRMAGTFGRAAAFSFYPAKILGCIGDGGAVVTDDDEIARSIRLLRDHGRNEAGDVEVWGFNSRLDNLQAAFLDFQFADYSSIIERRRALATLYQTSLGDVTELVLPPAPNADAAHFDVFQNYEIEAERRDELKSHLRTNGVGTLIQWGGKAVHQFERLGLAARLPVTERLFERCLMLPLNVMLSDEDVGYVCQLIRDFYA